MNDINQLISQLNTNLVHLNGRISDLQKQVEALSKPQQPVIQASNIVDLTKQKVAKKTQQRNPQNGNTNRWIKRNPTLFAKMLFDYNTKKLPWSTIAKNQRPSMKPGTLSYMLKIAKETGLIKDAGKHRIEASDELRAMVQKESSKPIELIDKYLKAAG